MAEWSIAAVLKTVELQGSVGSNPSLSAENKRGHYMEKLRSSAENKISEELCVISGGRYTERDRKAQRDLPE